MKEELRMKKIFTFILAGFMVLSAICLDVSAAKKSSKLSKNLPKLSTAQGLGTVW